MGNLDPIADMLTRIRNALRNKFEEVEVRRSNLKVDILTILKNEGHIIDFKEKKDNKQGMINIKLKYGPDKESVIKKINMISRPGRRVYCKKNEIPYPTGGYGTLIITTSKGVMTAKEARKNKIGGELLCELF